jgi:hypothetical protein
MHLSTPPAVESSAISAVDTSIHTPTPFFFNFAGVSIRKSLNSFFSKFRRVAGEKATSSTRARGAGGQLEPSSGPTL